MAKIKSIYTCQNCGYESPKWLGKCPSCNEWNTFVEEIKEPASVTKETAKKSVLTKGMPKSIN